jgi:hypothetical protein
MAMSADSGRYEIRVRGHLSRRRLCCVDGLEEVRRQANGETILTFAACDQAALHGLLNWLQTLGVTLLSVQCREEAEG